MYKKIKPILDFSTAFLLLWITLPIMLVISLVLWKINKGQIFFKQKRIGYQHQEFMVWKFQTMLEKRDNHGQLLPDDERLTTFGKILRKTSLDELPQLWNILKGEMSFIGPRPLLVEYLPLYNEKHLHRHDVLGGITGLAQVNGRNFLDWETRFDYDVWYVENISFYLDLKIVFLTFKTIFFDTKSVNSKEGKIMEKFRGYKK